MPQLSKVLPLSLILLFLGVYFAFTYSSNPPLGYTGAPGESNCSSCHGGVAVNSGPATRTLLLDGAPATSYVPGRTYAMSLTVSRATRIKYGFSLKVEDAQGNDAGTLISTTNRTDLSSGYLGQTSSGNLATTSGTITWNFQWIAPAAGTGPVTFYYSSNAANNNGSTNGDEIYTNQLALTEAVPSYTLSGVLKYDNTQATPVVGSSVSLRSSTGALLQSTTTNSTGAYSFANLGPGSYTVTGSSTRPWGGVTSGDALLITRQFNNLFNLTGLRLAAADVNLSNAINNSDALLTTRRVAGNITSFASGDWKFESLPITVGSANVVQDVRGLCYGDVNASYQPSVLRPSLARMLSDGVLEVAGSEQWVPLSLDATCRLGSLTLNVEAPSGWTMEAVRSELPGMAPEYKLEKGRLSLAWFLAEGFHLDGNRPFLWVLVRRDESGVNEGRDYLRMPGQEGAFSLFGTSEWTDEFAWPLEQLALKAPALRSSLSPGSAWSLAFPSQGSQGAGLPQGLETSGSTRVVLVEGKGSLHLEFRDTWGRLLGSRHLRHEEPETSSLEVPAGAVLVVGLTESGIQKPFCVKVPVF